MKILSSLLIILLLIVGVVVWVQKADAYGALTTTLRLFIVNTADALIGTPGLRNGMFSVYADVADCDPPDTKAGAFGNEWIFSLACETGPLRAKGLAHGFVQGFDWQGTPRRADDSDNN